MDALKLTLTSLTIFLCSFLVAQPVNDNCADAIPILVGTECIAGSYSSITATSEDVSISPNPSCFGYSGGDVWFTFEAPISGDFRVELAGNEWTLYSGTCGNFTQIICAPGNNNFRDPGLAGQTLYLRAYRWNSENGSDFTLCIWEPEAQANDYCADAIALAVGQECTSQDFSSLYTTSEDVSMAANPSCFGYSGGDVWFSFEVPASGDFRVELTGNEWTLYSGTCGNFTQIICAPGNQNFREPSLAGQTLYIRAYRWNSKQGSDFTLCVWEPEVQANDYCADAIALTVGQECTPQDFTSLYTTSEDVSIAQNPSCFGFSGGDVWFTFEVPASGNFRVELVGNDWTLYSGTCGDFTQIICAPGNNTFSELGLAGQTLYIRAYRWNSKQGSDFTLCVWEPEVQANDFCADAIALTVGQECTPQDFTSLYTTAEDVSVAASPSCFGYKGGDVWFNFEVPASGNFRVELAGNDWTLYSGSCGNFTEIICASGNQNFSEPSLAGQTLFIRAYKWNTKQGSDFTLCIWEVDVPENDNCANSTNIILNDSCASQSFTSRYATTEDVSTAQNPSCGLYKGGDVWFTFTAPESGQFSLERTSNSNGGQTQFAFYTGTCGNFEEFSCSAASETNFNDPLLGGQTITVRAFSWNNRQGADFDICIKNTTITENDNCAAALPLIVGESCTFEAFNNFNTTSEEGIAATPSCEIYQGGDVWFTFEVPSTGQFQINRNNISGGSYYYSIYTGTCGDFTEYDCSSDPAQSLYDAPELANQTVYLRVYRWNSFYGGEFELCIVAGDCSGELGGTSYIDECGNCVGGNTGLEPCVQDCNGVYGGTAYIDNCETCVGGNTGESPCVADCNGDFGGTAFLDECDRCVEGNTELDPCTVDCNGDYGGTAYLDNCETCVGGNTELDPCTADCNGDFGGTAYLDNCETCVGGNTQLDPCTVDCNGDFGGTAYFDNCETCVGGNTELDPCVVDCNGDFGGTAYLDNCETCVGGNTELDPCTADCNGDYGGTAYLDNCETCVGGNTQLDPCTVDCNGDFGGTAYFDNCETCVGGNTELDPCSADCNGDFGGTAYLDNCETCVGGNTELEPCVADCNGDFGGTAYLDNCETCVGGNTELEPCVQDCNGDFGGTAYLDNCETCVGGNTELDPCTADCNGDFGGTAYLDNCETCVGGNTELDPCNYDCPELEANFGDACDDENPETSIDMINAECECQGIIVYDCAVLEANVGDSCNDGNSETINDMITPDCECEGTIANPTICQEFVYYLADYSVETGTKIYDIKLNGGIAELTFLAQIPDEVHLAYNSDNNLIYAVSKLHNSYYTLNPHVALPVFTGPVLLSGTYGQITGAAFSEAGELLISSQSTKKIYSINVLDNTGSVYDEYAPILGGDIAFNASGDLYLTTNLGAGGLHSLYPGGPSSDILIAELSKNNTGLAITDSGELLLSERNSTSLAVYNDGGIAIGEYDLMLAGEVFTLNYGDLASGCSTYEIPSPGDCGNFSTFFAQYDETQHETTIFEVTFSGSDANLNEIVTVEDEFHIAFRAELNMLYLVSKTGSYFREYDLYSNNLSPFVPLDLSLNSITAADFNQNDGKLYVGNANTDMIYSIDPDLGYVSSYISADVYGGDLTIFEDGTIYLATQSGNALYDINSAASPTYIGGTPAKVTGLARANSESGLIISNYQSSVFIELNANNASPITAYSAKLNGESFTLMYGDMASGCVDEMQMDQLSNQSPHIKSEVDKMLLSSHPNPTSGASKVVFTTSNTGRILVEVYDMNGRNVATLFDQEAQQGKEYSLEFNGNDLPNGVYIYRLTNDKETIIEKFMIAK